MDLERYSDKLYKVGTRKETSETVKMANVSLILIICSFAVSFFTAVPSWLLQSGFALFIFLFSTTIFSISLIFSTIMIFVSKQPRKKPNFNWICYFLLITLIVVSIIWFVLVFRLFIIELTNFTGELTEDALVKILVIVTEKAKIFSTIIISTSLMFDVSMLLSFEIKNIEGDALAIFSLGVYLFIMIFKPCLIFADRITDGGGFITLLIDVLWVVSLSFLLKERTIDVACLVRIDENGNEIEEEKVKKPKKTVWTKKLKTLIEILTVGVIILLVRLTYSIKSNATYVTLGLEILGVAFACSYGFYMLSGKKLRKIDLIACVSSIFGFVLLLVNYSLMETISLPLIRVLGALGFITLIFGAVLFFFLQKNRRKEYFVVKLIAFIVLSITQIFYVVSLILTPDIDLKTHLEIVIPIMFVFAVLTFAVGYFLQRKKQEEIIEDIIK